MQVSAYAFGMELKPGERLKILMPVMARPPLFAEPAPALKSLHQTIKNTDVESASCQNQCLLILSPCLCP